jgi:integrase
MGRRKGITADEAKRILEAVKTPWVMDYVVALMETGARPGELASATAAGMASDGKACLMVGKTGERTVYLSAVAQAIFARLVAIHPEGPLFRMKNGDGWNQNASRCVFRRLRKRTGIPHATPYSCRHLFGTQGIRRGVDSILMAELMGHKDVTMLMEHYHHAEKDTLRDAADRATHREESGTSGPTD